MDNQIGFDQGDDDNFVDDDKIAEEKLLERIAPLAAGLDPNWLRVRFESNNGAVHVVVNGPKHGDIEFVITDKEVLNSIDLSRCVVNPNHKFAPAPDMMLINFENCDTGIVKEVTGSGFVVRRDDSFDDVYTVERLVNELKMQDVFEAQAVSVSYFPCRLVRSVYSGCMLLDGREYALARDLFFDSSQQEGSPRNESERKEGLARFTHQLESALAEHRKR